MTFEQLLQVLSVETHLNLDEAIDSGGCTLEFDKNIRVTLEHHNGCVYIFSRERSEFCVTVKLLQRNHVIQSPVKIDG